jgi:hypothetical protein
MQVIFSPVFSPFHRLDCGPGTFLVKREQIPFCKAYQTDLSMPVGIRIRIITTAAYGNTMANCGQSRHPKTW